MPITIYTMDGTGSPSATLPNGDGNPGGGFPASVATNLVAADPVTWVWYPVDYQPGFGIIKDVPIDGTEGIANSGSAKRAINIVTAQVLNSKPNNYFVLCGLSQGAWIADMLYEEIRNPSGSLYSKRDKLLAIVTFGSPRRPNGHTLTSACLAESGYTTGDIIDPAGQGACGSGVYNTSFGTVPGIMTSPPTDGTIQWFCNQNDAASDSSAMLNANVQNAIAAVAHFIWKGSVTTALTLIDQLFNIIVGYHLSDVEKANTIDVFKQWEPFVGGKFGLPPGGPPHNPHAQYNDPYPYSSINGNTLSAVTIATNYLLKLGAGYATGPEVPISKSSYSWWQTPPD